MQNTIACRISLHSERGTRAGLDASSDHCHVRLVCAQWSDDYRGGQGGVGLDTIRTTDKNIFFKRL